MLEIGMLNAIKTQHKSSWENARTCESSTLINLVVILRSQLSFEPQPPFGDSTVSYMYYCSVLSHTTIWQYLGMTHVINCTVLAII